MRYTLVGFTHQLGFRVFAFEGVGEDRVRTMYSVSADLSLIRKYGIRMQELPLLCRGILDRRGISDEQSSFTYTEDDMHQRALFNAANETGQKRGPRKKPVAEQA